MLFDGLSKISEYLDLTKQVISAFAFMSASIEFFVISEKVNCFWNL